MAGQTACARTSCARAISGRACGILHRPVRRGGGGVGVGPLPPIGRIGQASDVAAAAVFYASDQAAFVTGTTLLVDGGVTGGYLQRGSSDREPPACRPHSRRLVHTETWAGSRAACTTRARSW